MKEDSPVNEATDIGIAIVQEMSEAGEEMWSAYFFNLKEEEIESILINVSAVGFVEGEEKYTPTMRMFINNLAPLSYKKFEAILPEALRLNNRYWVSFYHNQKIYEKKFLIGADTNIPDNFVIIPFLNKPGLFVQ